MSDPQHTYLVLNAKGHTAATKPATRANAEPPELGLYSTPADAWIAYLETVQQNEGPTPKPEAFVIVGAVVVADLITFDWSDTRPAGELARLIHHLPG
jgi:hypothetical protein